MTKIKIANFLKSFSIAILLILSITFLIFALLSGAEQAGGGLKGIILNNPNTLPWIILLSVVILAQKKELVGGLLIVLLGLASIYFFKTLEKDHLFVFFLVSLPLLFLGGLLVISRILSK
jgi:hypothetical protein